MAGKQMEGDNTERRKHARESREGGRKPSETGGTFGASKQRQEAKAGSSHQERIDLKREGKPDDLNERISVARPGSRDRDTEDRERFPRR